MGCWADTAAGMWIHIVDQHEHWHRRNSKNLPKAKTILHKIPGRPLESVRADILTIMNKHYPCTVDYHSMFWVIKQNTGAHKTMQYKHFQNMGYSTENLIQICTTTFFKIAAAQQDNVRCRHKIHIREVWELLQVIQHALCHVIILQPSKQQTKRNMHKVIKRTMKKCFKTTALVTYRGCAPA